MMWKILTQLLSVYHHTFLWIILPLVSIWVPIYVLFTQFWWVMCLYFVWFIYDFDTPRLGSRNWVWYRGSRIWRYFADYFPIKVVKTTELSSDQNFIMGCHPHGILSIGAFIHLCTNATNFHILFPGLKTTIVTLNGQFWFPFRREIGIGLGAIECSRHSLAYLLRHPQKGRIIGIVIGGAEEALDAHPGKHTLNIMNRHGFCRIALMTGTSLVPSYSFGENDLYYQYPNPRGSRIRTIQSYIKNRFGFCPPLFMGRGFFSERFGIMPRNRPIVTVVGTPIKVKCFKSPTRLQVQALHALYCTSLIELFERHKGNYGIPKHVHLELK